MHRGLKVPVVVNWARHLGAGHVVHIEVIETPPWKRRNPERSASHRTSCTLLHHEKCFPLRAFVTVVSSRFPPLTLPSHSHLHQVLSIYRLSATPPSNDNLRHPDVKYCLFLDVQVLSIGWHLPLLYVSRVFCSVDTAHTIQRPCRYRYSQTVC